MRLRNVTLGALCAAILAFVTVPATAQVFTGRIEVTVVDSTGAVLPGATVEISGPQSRMSVTDGRGNAQFLNLAPGTYTVIARLAGFQTYRNTDVPVVIGGNVPLKVTLNVETIAQDVFVTAESPVIDTKRQTTQTNVTLAELQEIPTSRDPWVVLQTVPGVVVDRVNVGGADSGQQSVYKAKGAPRTDNTWSIDGVPITDMAALGSSPTYYDFDMFQEMQVLTGGADLGNPTPGVALNMVLKGGTNTPHGSARFFFENEGMQANNLPDDLRAALGGVTGKGNRIDEYKDYGFELGGPILRDRLWAWGAFGKTDITVITLANTPDQTILENYSFKATGQATQDLRGNFTFFRGAKLKYGRGASPTRPPETTWDQGGPTQLFKGEGNYVLGSNLFLSGRFAYVDGGFFLTPQGGLDAQWYFDDGGSSRGSYYRYETVRPQHNASGEGNYFRGRHEVRFGFGWRRADVDSISTVPGNGIITYHDGYPTMYAEVTAWGHTTGARGVYANAYVGDTISWDRVTANLGLRWDRQAGSVKSFTTGSSSVLPDILPAITGSPRNNVVVWNSVTPRVGVSYALDESRRTLARASYSMFASQLNATAGNFMSTAQYRGVYIYDVVDTNGNQIADPSELAGLPVGNWYGFDFTNPGDLADPIHRVGDYDTPITHEVQFGVDRELMRNFGLSGTVTFRRLTNFVWRNNGLRASDYEQIGTCTPGVDPCALLNAPGGLAGSVPIYGVIPERIPANRAATIYTKRDGYHQRFLGFEVAATKRMSDRWMARFGFSTNDHTEHFDSPQALGSFLTTAAATDPTPSPTAPNRDGGAVVTNDTASGKVGIWQVLPKYQFIATGVYQAPYGINLGINLLSRQGYAMPFHRTQVTTDDPMTRLKTVLLADKVTQFRLPTLNSLDVRVGKEFRFGRTKANLDLDIFNMLNASTVLLRQYDLRVTTANNILEIMNPRVLRVGVRFSF